MVRRRENTIERPRAPLWAQIGAGLLIGSVVMIITAAILSGNKEPSGCLEVHDRHKNNIAKGFRDEFKDRLLLRNFAGSLAKRSDRALLRLSRDREQGHGRRLRHRHLGAAADRRQFKLLHGHARARHNRDGVPKGFNQIQIMVVTGHKDIRSVQRYTHLNATDVVKLLD